MGYSVSGNTITLTRGDTFIALVSIMDSDGYPYTPAEGDKVRFAMKSAYSDPVPVLFKDIPIDTMLLEISPDDTSDLPMGKKYVYDIELTKANGVVDTFIKGKLNLTEEVC